MTTFVLFGGTGDLAKRKIIPALFSAFLNNRLDTDFTFYGAAREALSDDEFRARVTASITNYAKPGAAGTPEQLEAFLKLTFYGQTYQKLLDYSKMIFNCINIILKVKIFY